MNARPDILPRPGPLAPGSLEKAVRLLALAGSVVAFLSLGPVFAWYVLDAISRS